MISRLQRVQFDIGRVKKRRQQLWWQIVILSLIILFLSIWFLLMAFPMMVRETGRKNSLKFIPNQRELKPQMPLINVPPAYTNVKELRLSGFGTPNAKVYLMVNENEKQIYEAVIGINGEFLLNIDLNEGENVLRAYSINEQGLRSNDARLIKVVLDQGVPEIELWEPENNQEIIGKDRQMLKIKGQTEPQVRVLINNMTVWADSEGKFEFDYKLQTGENEIKIVAIDQAENQAEEQIYVYFQP